MSEPTCELSFRPLRLFAAVDGRALLLLLLRSL
jgi:hypothetical protein